MKAMMMPKSMMFAITVLHLFIVSWSTCVPTHITPLTMAQMQSTNDMMARLKRLMCWYRLVMTMPASVAMAVAMRMGMKTSVGCAAPICAL